MMLSVPEPNEGANERSEVVWENSAVVDKDNTSVRDIPCCPLMKDGRDGFLIVGDKG